MRAAFAVNAVVHPSRSLFEGRRLDMVQRLLTRHAPQWSEQARIWRSEADQRPVNLDRPGVLEEAVRGRLDRQEKVLRALEAQVGPAPYRRLQGSVELRGQGLIVLARADEYQVAPAGDRWLFANRLTLQLRHARIEGEDSVAWCRRIFEALCSALSPLNGMVYHREEYDDKNISSEGGGAAAVGVDASRYLPGIYWLNFFGKLYCDLIGRERLLSAPAAEARQVGDGALVRLAGDPRQWESKEYKAVERRTLDHIGPEYFFSKESPNRPTIAPAFKLPARRGGS